MCLLSTLWLKLFTMVHETNLVIEVRDANIDCLMKYIQLICKKWDVILQEAKLVAQNEGILSDFPIRRHLSTQSEAEQHYKVKVLITIIDSILSDLQCRFKSLRHIWILLGFLWQFSTLNNEELSVADQFCERYAKYISRELFEELIFLKRIYSTNFKLPSMPHYIYSGDA